jgi:3-oxoadipate CoA-transferase beta subunit
MSPAKWTDEQVAALIARDLPNEAFVNLGIGLPTLVASFLPPGKEIFFHSENGILGMGPRAEGDQVDWNLVDAGKNPVTLVPGASIIHHADSFAVIRGGHLDAAVLGGMQVAANGDLANWKVPGTDLGSVGGAMDLATGAKATWVFMRQLDRDGTSKLVKECTYSLTGKGCVDRVYTELAVIDVTSEGFVVTEMAPGLTQEEMQAATGAPVRFALKG